MSGEPFTFACPSSRKYNKNIDVLPPSIFLVILAFLMQGILFQKMVIESLPVNKSEDVRTKQTIAQFSCTSCLSLN